MFIPDIKSIPFECKPGSTPHVFVNMARYAIFKYRVFGKDGPVKDTEYEFSVTIKNSQTGEVTVSKRVRSGNTAEPVTPAKTDENGLIEHKIPADAASGKIVLTTQPKKTIEFAFGNLDPLEIKDTDNQPVFLIKAAQQRLLQLGYYYGEIDNELSPKTKNAISGFQGDHNLNLTGELDAATCSKLEEEYGC